MAAIAWVFIGVMALCGSTWSYSIGEANLNKSTETAITSDSSETNEDTGILSDLKPIEVADDEETNQASDTELEHIHEEVKSSEEKQSSEGVLDGKEGENKVRVTSEISLPRLGGYQEQTEGEDLSES